MSITFKELIVVIINSTKERKLLWKFNKQDDIYTTKIKNYKITYSKYEIYNYAYPSSETLILKNTTSGVTYRLTNEGKLSNLYQEIVIQKEETKEEMIENILEILK